MSEASPELLAHIRHYTVQDVHIDPVGMLYILKLVARELEAARNPPNLKAESPAP